MDKPLEITPIAHIHTDFNSKFGIPRQSGRAPSAEGRIVFLPKYRNPDALRGIELFSHLWLIFDFSESHRAEWSPTVRPPRLGGNTKIGVFASRSPFRPNPIGLSCVQFVRIEHTRTDGNIIVVKGADLLDKTPIIDIKPYLPFADAHPEATGGYADNFTEHRLNVIFPPELLSLFPESKQNTLIECLADDPRPSYQNDAERIYTMIFSDYEIDFSVANDTLSVVGIRKPE